MMPNSALLSLLNRLFLKKYSFLIFPALLALLREFIYYETKEKLRMKNPKFFVSPGLRLRKGW